MAHTAATLLLLLFGVGEGHGVLGGDLEVLQPRHGGGGLHVVLKLNEGDPRPRLHHAHLRGGGAGGRRGKDNQMMRGDDRMMRGGSSDDEVTRV